MTENINIKLIEDSGDLSNANMTSKTTGGETEAENLQNIVSFNLKELSRRRGITQRDIAEKTGFCAAAVCRYFKDSKTRGNQFPPINFLYQLKKLYGISIDDFISRRMVGDDSKEAFSDDRMLSSQDVTELETARKYCGNYIVYYLDTSNYKGRDNTDAAEAVMYGVLNIHEVITNFKYVFRSYAFLGIDSREEAEKLKAELDKQTDSDKISEFVDSYKEKKGQSSIYNGSFDFGAKHAYITLRHGNMDRALIILYRIESNKSNYRGGLGVVNSGSKGREKMPTAQFIALSRYPISLSEEELHNELLLTYPRLKADDKNVTELISVFKKTFLPSEGASDVFNEEQKELMFKAFLENTIKTIVTNNMNRCAKASEKDDASWYKLIKREMNNSKNKRDSKSN